ncbi:MAG: hypothetical protein ACR2F2_08755 [Pyrinomonadaceae bacterium]
MSRLIKFSIVSISVLFNFACQPNQEILNSKRKTPEASANSVKRPQDTFEAALRGVQNSGFDYIFVIRRKDNEKINAEDGRYIKRASPPETNQFILTDEERVVIAGSNYPFPEESLEILRKVFDVEDLSPKKAENNNADSNSKTDGNSNKQLN